MRVAVTGAGGFLGTHLVRHLLGRGMEVRGLRRGREPSAGEAGLDIEWAEADLAVEDPPRSFPGDADVLVHLAALYAEGEREFVRLRAVNVGGTARCLRACERDGVGRFVYVGTMGACAHPALGRPATEADRVPLEGGAASAYARTKLLGEDLALSWSGGEAVAVLPAAPVGAFDRGPSVTGARILDILRGRMPRLLAGPMTYAPAASVALGIWLAAESGRPGERYLLGGESLGPEEFLARVAEIAGVPAPSRTLGDRLLRRRRRSPGSLTADDRKAREELGYRPGDLETAIAEAVRYFRSTGRV